SLLLLVVLSSVNFQSLVIWPIVINGKMPICRPFSQRCCPVDRIFNDPLDSWMIISREGFMTWVEVKNLPVTPAIGHASAEYFSVWITGNKNQFIRRRNVKVFSIHFFLV